MPCSSWQLPKVGDSWQSLAPARQQCATGETGGRRATHRAAPSCERGGSLAAPAVLPPPSELRRCAAPAASLRAWEGERPADDLGASRAAARGEASAAAGGGAAAGEGGSRCLLCLLAGGLAAPSSSLAAAAAPSRGGGCGSSPLARRSRLRECGRPPPLSVSAWAAARSVLVPREPLRARMRGRQAGGRMAWLRRCRYAAPPSSLPRQAHAAGTHQI